MAKTRQRARAERERLAAIAAAERRAAAERTARRRARRARLDRMVGGLRRWTIGVSGRGRPTGVLAQRRARQGRLTVVALAAVLLLVWLVTQNLAAVALAAVAGALVAPVVYTLISRKD